MLIILAGLAGVMLTARERLRGREAHQVVARAVNIAGWAAAASLLYRAGISYMGRDNEKIEPVYAEPPVSPLRPDGPRSKAPFGELSREGRRYVTDVVTPDFPSFPSFPSFLCWQKVPAGRQQFRALLWGVKERLGGRPAGRKSVTARPAPCSGAARRSAT